MRNPSAYDENRRQERGQAWHGIALVGVLTGSVNGFGPRRRAAPGVRSAEAEELRARGVLESAAEEVTEMRPEWFQYSQELCDSLIRHNPDVVCLLDDRGIVVEANPATEQILGYPEADIVGLPWAHLLPRKERARHRRAYQQTLSGEVVTMDVRVFHQDGHVLVMHSKYIPISVDGQVVGGFWIGKDLTEQQRLLQRIQESEAKYELIATHMTDLVCVLRPDGVVQYASPSYERVLGISAAAYVGQPVTTIVHPTDRPVLLQGIADAIATQQPVTVELRIYQEATHRYIYVETDLKAVINRRGQAEHVLAIARDITERKARAAQLARLAFYDPLTGLPNRRLLRERLDQYLRESAETATPLAVLFLDCDRFKQVNDAYGHDVGDRLLEEFAKRVRSCVRDSDLVSRLAGDEFCVVLPGTDRRQAVQVADRILQACNQPWNIEGHIVEVTLSIGVAVYPEHGKDAPTLLRHADQAMYQAKVQGKNAQCVFAGVGSGQ